VTFPTISCPGTTHSVDKGPQPPVTVWTSDPQTYRISVLRSLGIVYGTYTTEFDGDGDIVRALGLELEVLNSKVLVVLGVYMSIRE